MGMKSLFMILVAALAVLGGGAGCREKSSARPLSLGALEKTRDGRISFEEKGDEIFVHLTDRLGDSHLHRLDFGGVPKAKALELLKAKQAELENTGVGLNAKQRDSSTGRNVATRPFDRHREFERIYEFIQTTESGSSVRLPKPVVIQRITREEVVGLFGEPGYKGEELFTYDLSFSQSAETWVESQGHLYFKDDVLVDYQVITTWGPVK